MNIEMPKKDPYTNLDESMVNEMIQNIFCIDMMRTLFNDKQRVYRYADTILDLCVDVDPLMTKISSMKFIEMYNGLVNHYYEELRLQS